MAKTQDIKRRIRSIRNTMQLTRAMKMVASAKLRRAQQTMFAARPYAERTQSILQGLAARASDDASPLLRQHGDDKIDVVLVTGDKGLCGAFNTNIIRQAETLIADSAGKSVSISAIGKKGRDYFRRRDFDVPREWTDVFRDVDFALAKKIADRIIELYVGKKVDRVHLVYNEFKSAIQARPVVQQLLPVRPESIEAGEFAEDYIYEPGSDALLAKLLPHYVEIEVYRALIESVAAEHAARMTAMDSATNNAGELIDSLTLTMNRVRQASITTEIIEVVSGAQALG